MLKFLGTLARIVFGWVLASLAAGLVTVLFVDIEVLAGALDRLPKTLGETFELALLAATHIAIFAAVFVLIIAAISEWFSIRALAFYLLFGVALALIGFSVQYASEVAGQPTILNNYALKAFLAVGFAGGFVYWLAAGQFAGQRPPEDLSVASDTSAVEAETPASGTDATEVIISRPTIEERPRWRMPRLERLRFAPRSQDVLPASAADSSPDDQKSSS